MVTTTTYYINLNYICNERCVFCASDLTNNPSLYHHRPSVTLSKIQEWIKTDLPEAHDQVMLAGGEPTLHKELCSIIRFLGQNSPNIALFTNGLRLSDRDYARQVLDAGVTQFEIALFGATAQTHDVITRVPGSFTRTLTALKNLLDLRTEYSFLIDIRLLISRDTYAENPAIVEMIDKNLQGIDAISLNRLILSENATRADATISWQKAHESINKTASMIRERGYNLQFVSLPLCIFNEDNALYVKGRIKEMREHVGSGLLPANSRFRYLDPLLDTTSTDNGPVSNRTMLPELCKRCHYSDVCWRIEDWYFERYGTEGLAPITL